MGTFLFSTSPKSFTTIDVKSSSDSEKTRHNVKLKLKTSSLHPSEYILVCAKTNNESFNRMTKNKADLMKDSVSDCDRREKPAVP